MMRPNSILRREDKRHIAVMAGFIDLVHERRRDANSALTVCTVAICTNCVVSPLSDLFLI